MPKRKSEMPYTRSEINAIIDSLLHPWIDRYPWLISVDSLLHALNEGNPEESLRKFMKYNLPKVLEEIAKWLRQT